MASDARDRAERLARVLELSVRQLELLKDKRYAELLACQEERDSLMAAFNGLEPGKLGGEPGVRELAGRILENDRLISLIAVSTQAELSEKLSHRARTKRAIKAYGSG